MAATTTFDAVSNVGSRFHIQRINRRLDDRDNVIKEAIGILEEKDPTYFPTITSVTTDNAFAAGNLSAGNAVCSVGGVNLSATASDWTIMVGGVAGQLASQSATAGVIQMGAALTVAQGSQYLVQIWISDTLATEFFVTAG